MKLLKKDYWSYLKQKGKLRLSRDNVMFLIILGLLIAGVLAGKMLRGYIKISMDSTINVLVWILLFILGVKVGCDERIVRGIVSLGWEAAIICAGTVIGSCTAAWILWKISGNGGGR